MSTDLSSCSDSQTRQQFRLPRALNASAGCSERRQQMSWRVSYPSSLNLLGRCAEWLLGSNAKLFFTCLLHEDKGNLHEENSQAILNQCCMNMKQKRGCFPLWFLSKDTSLHAGNFLFPVRGWSLKLGAITLISTIWPGPPDPSINSEVAEVLMDGFEEGWETDLITAIMQHPGDYSKFGAFGCN